MDSFTCGNILINYINFVEVVGELNMSIKEDNKPKIIESLENVRTMLHRDIHYCRCGSNPSIVNRIIAGEIINVKRKK